MTFRITRTAPCVVARWWPSLRPPKSDPLASPDTRWEYFGRHVALLFRKANNTWSYVGILGAVDAADEWTTPGLAMKNGVAMVIEKSVRVFEGSGSTWTQAPIDIRSAHGTGRAGDL